MITCYRNNEGLICIDGIPVQHAEIAHEALCMIFNEARKEEHRHIRHQILELIIPLSDILDKTTSRENEPTLFKI